jgi:EpsI family protein
VKKLLPILLGTLLVLGLIAAHFDSLVAMVGLWSRSPMYSYAFTVPLISAYLFWTKRAKLRQLIPAPSRLGGAAVIALGLTLLLLGRIGGVQVIEQLAFLVCFAGAVVFVLGREYLRVGWAGFAYLLLMIPIWDGLTESLHEPFQNYSAAVGTAVLRAMGIPAYREATVIALPNLNIEVARACSGVNYLVAVLALGLPLSYVQLKSNRRRVLLLACAVLIAALSNALRVVLISALAYYEVGSALHGPFHVLHGLFVAGIGYVALFVGLRVLAEPSATSSARRSGSENAHGRVLGRLRIADLALLATLFWLVGATAWSPVAASGAGVSRLNELPMQLGGWSGERLSAHPTEWWNGPDDQIRRRYRRLSGSTVDVYVGYFASQRHGKELASYRSAGLHRQAVQMVVADTPTGQLQVNVVRGAGHKNALSIFWYDLRGSAETGQYWAKLRSAWNVLVHGRNDGHVVMLSVILRRSGDEAAALSDLKDLATLVHEALAASREGRRASARGEPGVPDRLSGVDGRT